MRPYEKQSNFFIITVWGIGRSVKHTASNIHGKSGEFYNLTAHYLANIASVNVEKTMTVGGNTLLTGALNVLNTQNSANAITLTTDGGPNETIVIENKQGTSGEAIHFLADKGQIQIQSNANKGLLSVGADIYLTTNGGTNDQIVIENKLGTSHAAIALLADKGQIFIQSSAGLGGANGTADIYLTTNKGASETILIQNKQGTNKAAVTLLANKGGIWLSATNGKNLTPTSTATNGGITFNGMVNSHPETIAYNGANGTGTTTTLSVVSNVNIINPTGTAPATTMVMPAGASAGQVCLIVNQGVTTGTITWPAGVTDKPTPLTANTAYMFICAGSNNWKFIG